MNVASVSPDAPAVLGAIEPCFTVQQVARLWQCSHALVREAFRDRHGVMRLGLRGRPCWRIPLSVVIEVMVERGYAPSEAYRILGGEGN